MTTRREFIGGVAALAAMPSFAKGTDEIRAVFLRDDGILEAVAE